MQLLDWCVVVGYVLLALAIGLRYSRRAGQDVDQYFLSGRTLPWWLAGTSMVATTFAADTPLVISGWVRDLGIWKNWLWWCFAINGMLGVFLFARWWRRGQVMTKAELAELRYGGPGARVLRGVLGGLHAGVSNTMVLCWVLLAAYKIISVLFEVEDKALVLGAACALALSYSLMAGFWGVVVTDLVQFTMAVIGALALAFLCWEGIGGGAGFEAARAGGEVFGADTLRFLPSAGEGASLWPGSWSVPFAALAVYLGVAWWAIEGVDGESTIVQRVSASRDARQGMLATLWFCVAHFALRPWPWILVAIASLVVLPTIEVRAGAGGEVVSTSEAEVVLAGGGSAPLVTSLVDGYEPDWRPRAVVKPYEVVEPGALIARTDSERAYVVMMRRFLPVGLLGLVVASLLAAFMSTIDTHVNLASSYFVNDLYRRFLHPGASERHYVLVARLASAAVLVLGGVFAYFASHIGSIFELFLALLAGVGPVYVLRWTWWRVRASTEITAMIASAATALVLTFVPLSWPDTNFTPGGVLEPTARTCLTVLVSGFCSALSLWYWGAPDPESLVPFYRRVRPLGWWGPVRALCPDVAPPREAGVALVGVLGGLALTYGALFGLGHLFLGTAATAAVGLGVAVVGGVVVARVMSRFGADGEVRAS